ncbi:MAG: hypothetical protein ACFFDJ_05135 [Candidatus Odinarchaeota archaeon]
MGLIGFILLLVGSGLLLVTSTSIMMDPAYAAAIAVFINSILGAPIGNMIVNVLLFTTSIGGILVLVGAIIWYAAGSGGFALIGRILVTLGSFSAIAYLVTELVKAYFLGIFSEPLGVILTYFLGLGLGFASVVLIVIGDLIGAGRKKEPKPANQESV